MEGWGRGLSKVHHWQGATGLNKKPPLGVHVTLILGRGRGRGLSKVISRSVGHSHGYQLYQQEKTW